jgi:hypothetical protein
VGHNVRNRYVPQPRAVNVEVATDGRFHEILSQFVSDGLTPKELDAVVRRFKNAISSGRSAES